MEEECVMSYENINIKKFLEEKAEKTGNLVSLRSVEPAWNMDLLLDIGSE